MITNTGKPINLDRHVVDVTGMYSDWEYVNGMSFITDSELFQEMYVHSEGIDLESNRLTGFPLGKKMKPSLTERTSIINKIPTLFSLRNTHPPMIRTNA